MTRTQHLRRAGIILFAILVGVSIFLGNQRPVHALDVPSGSEIVCFVFTSLNHIGNPIPVLDANECAATSTPSGGGTLKVVKIVEGTSTPPSSFDIHVHLLLDEVSGSPQPGSSSGVSFIGLVPAAYLVSEESNDGSVDVDDFETSYDSCPVGVAVVAEGEVTTCTITNTWIGSDTPLPMCSDTLDNDTDGKTDIDDPDCHTDGDPSNPSSYDPDADEDNSSLPQCWDGIDNDNDGKTDWGVPGAPGRDPDCSTPTDDSEAGGGGSGGDEDTLAKCSDAIDNDEDELVVLADPDCDDFTPTLTIVKNTTGGNATFSFDISAGTPNTANVTTSGGGGSSSEIRLTAGTSTVLEDAAVDWTLSSVACTEGGDSIGTSLTRGMEFTAAVGDEIICTFSNIFTEGGGGGGGEDGSDVSVAKSVDKAAPNRGDTIIYTLTVSVAGESATGLVVHDALPAGLTFVSTSTSDIVGVYSSTTADWTIPSLASSSAATLHITATINSDLAFGTVIANTASVTAGDTSDNGDNDTSSASVTVTDSSSNGGSSSNNDSSSGGSSGGRARNKTLQGQVLGAATTTPQACNTPLLTSYLRRGLPNDPVQVKKLQQFLNSDPATQLAIVGPGSPGNETGFFGPLTDAAVRKFQVKYAKDVLEPWNPFGLINHYPTGYVYKTTLRKINLVYCANLSIPFPTLP